MSTNRAEFADLVDVWWKTAEIMNAMPGCDASYTQVHGACFERILNSCGWTTQEWNEAVALHSKKD